MYCKYCHRPIDDSNTVCPYCGKPNKPSPKKKSRPVRVFIYTFIALLLFALVVHFFPVISNYFVGKDDQSDKVQSTPPKQQDTLPTFTKKSTESIHGSLGNSIANYSNYICQLAECKDYIFHCYDRLFRISLIEKATDKVTTLPINGINLSIYNNTLYYSCPERTTIYAYDLVSGDIYEPNIPDKPNDSSTYDQFFIFDKGFIIVYGASYWTEMICVCDFNGNILFQKKIHCGKVLLLDNNTLLTMQENLLITLSLPSLDQSSVSAPEGFYDYDSFGDGFIYGFYKSDEYNCIMKVNPLSGEAEMLPVDDLKGFSLSCNDNVIYYTSQSGTSAITTSGNIVGNIHSTYHTFDISFTSNGYMYCEASKVRGDKLVSTFPDHFCCSNYDGTNFFFLH